jgi:quinoprotein glucose dehydrogenase
MKDPGLAKDVADALQSREPELLREAVRLVPAVKLDNAEALLEKLAVGKGPAGARQAAVTSLAALGADAALARLPDGGLAMDAMLEWMDAASKRPALKEKAAKVQSGLAANADALEGGDAAVGRRIFFERSDVQCLRCHTIAGQGGQVGPDLSKIAAQKDRMYLLDSMLLPNKQIAEGWGQTAFQMQSDAVEVGRIEKETDAAVTLLLPDGQRKQLAKADIKARKTALSAMPEDIAKQLSRRDLRDLVAFLATLR